MMQFAPGLDNPDVQPPKTSRLAITSLIFSLILCCPLTTILGPLLGLVSVIRIGGNPALKGRGIAVLMLHPGLVATDLTKDFPRDMPWIEPDEAAAGLIRNIDELTIETSGKFRHANGDYLPW